MQKIISNTLRKTFINIRSKRFREKIIAFESDDWGSVRMKSQKSYAMLLKQGVPVDKSYFTMYDTLESLEDLESLIGVLDSHKNVNGNSPIITCNSLVANPDFEKIKDSNYQEYFYEGVEDTHLKYFTHNKVLELYKNCNQSGKYLRTEFHGREHLNVRKFKDCIVNDKNFDRLGVDLQSLLGLVSGNQLKSRKYYNSNNYMAGFESLDKEHEIDIINIVEEGVKSFEALYGVRPMSFVAQSLIYPDSLLDCLNDLEIRYIQGAQQFNPVGNGRLKVINRYSGFKNDVGQVFWRRNATFEPSSFIQKDWVSSCLKEIALSFTIGAPCVINTHRVNFVGGISIDNRDRNLFLLDKLLSEVLKRWPEVVFMSSSDLGKKLN